MSAHNIQLEGYFKSEFDFNFIGFEQFEDHFLVRFVVFNPGSTAMLLKSFAAFEGTNRLNPLCWIFPRYPGKRIQNTRWSPTDDDRSPSAARFCDAYRMTFVTDFRLIVIRIPGKPTEEQYSFELKTNHGYRQLKTSVDYMPTAFPYDFSFKRPKYLF